MADNKPSQADIEEQFREQLDDLVQIGTKLAAVCSSVTELVELMELARTNDGQLRLILSQVLPQATKK